MTFWDFGSSGSFPKTVRFFEMKMLSHLISILALWVNRQGTRSHYNEGNCSSESRDGNRRRVVQHLDGQVVV